MDLIIKPTEACNFACTFCSSSYLVDKKTERLELQKIYDFLKRFPETNTIIVNGGDPLMMSPEYYQELIDHLRKNKYKANISFTSNLWDFYKKPDRWSPIFKQRDVVNVVTSFHYGDNRLISPGRVLDDLTFTKIIELFEKEIGYRPDFISVIDEHNYHKAINNVYLAKSLGVTCKLNYANASGRQEKAFLVSYMYKVYKRIWEEGLAKYEWNTKQLVHSLIHEPRICPRSRECDNGIRVIQPDGRYFPCGAFGDERQYDIDFEAEIYRGEFFKPLQAAPELFSLKDECLSCPMFNLCNGCRKHIQEIKDQGEVEKHCGQMKALEEELNEMKEEILRTNGYMNEANDIEIHIQD